jgi:seryl-tRNA synthetase
MYRFCDVVIMRFDLTGVFTFSSSVSAIETEFDNLISLINTSIFEKNSVEHAIQSFTVKKNQLILDIVYESSFRPHNALLQMKNLLSKELGKKHRIGVREITIKKYEIQFDLEKKPLRRVSIPFAEVKFDGTQVTLMLQGVSEEFLQRNYIDRMITLVKEKVQNQYYEGKGEFWKLIWKSGEKKPVWNKDPTEEMVELGWLEQGPTKGKWFFRPQATAVLKTMEKIAVEEILKPLGFQEVVASHIIPFDIWLKTGHLEGMPGEFYYVAEPLSRDVARWERFTDLTKITQEIPFKELEKNISTPTAGICYAQCLVIYWSFMGKTIAEDSLPILVYDKTAISGRYESGGRHGIERVDEFHRIEPVYIGTREQLLNLREELLERYKYVFNTIFDLEWRMAWVTPWYMQQAGKHEQVEQDCGTIDFEAYMPYRGDREHSEWLEFQNLSIIGDKYIKVFNIKAQKSALWSGCSGIGLERWTSVFLAQKGLDPRNWPPEFRKFLDELPERPKFL